MIRMFKPVRSSLVALALGTLAVIASPLAAHASDTSSTSRPAAVSPSTASADGYLYAYLDAYGVDKYCRFSGSDGDWSTCSPYGNMRNRASDLWNNGYAGSYGAVRVYWGLGQSGAYACIDNGWEYYDLSQWRFPNNGSGGGQIMNDNTSSNYWVGSCSSSDRPV